MLIGPGENTGLLFLKESLLSTCTFNMHTFVYLLLLIFLKEKQSKCTIFVVCRYLFFFIREH